MESAFTFGFSGDDIDISYSDDGDEGPRVTSTSPHSEVAPSLVPPRRHGLQELLSSLPSKISFFYWVIQTSHGNTVQLPRRELFDVRMQLMAEDDPVPGSTASGPSLLTTLGNDDIKSAAYEGGLKSWECSMDLAELLLADEHYLSNLKAPGLTHIIELGAGTALPSIALFYLALLTSARPVHFTLCDYNVDVLRLVSVPNLLLAWAVATHLLTPTTGEAGSAALDLDVTPALLNQFSSDLEERCIVVDSISGAWSPAFADAVSTTCAPARRLVLASETIYSPQSLSSFTEVLMKALREVPDAQALVAAKRVYFGVGGGYVEFLRVLHDLHGVASPIMKKDGAGVSRIVSKIARDMNVTRSSD